MPEVEVYEAQLIGAQKALEAAIPKAGSGPIKVLLDKPAAVEALQKGLTKPSVTGSA